MSTVLLRRNIPLWLSIIAATIIALRSFIIDPSISYWAGLLTTWGTVVVAIISGLGVVNLILFHTPKIRSMQNKPVVGQWFYSASTIIFTVLFVVIGLTQLPTSSMYLWWYNVWVNPIAGLISFISAYFSLTGTYRAFKIRTLEGAALVIPALLIFLYDCPLGPYLFPFLGPIGVILFGTIGGSMMRSAIVAIGMGMIYISLRTIFGMERGYMYEEGA